MWHSLGQDLPEPLGVARLAASRIGTISRLLQCCDGLRGYAAVPRSELRIGQQLQCTVGGQATNNT